mgnify:CR=1 FL=1
MFDFMQNRELNPLDDQLSDAVSPLNRVIVLGISVEHDHLQFAAVTGIDEARSIDQCDAVFQCEATTGQNETCITLGNGHCDARWHERSAALTLDYSVLSCVQVDSGVALVCKLWQWQARVELLDCDFQHTVNLFDTV